MIEAISSHHNRNYFPEFVGKLSQAKEIFNRHYYEAELAVEKLLTGIKFETGSVLTRIDTVRRNITTAVLEDFNHYESKVRVGLAMIMLGSILLTACVTSASAVDINSSNAEPVVVQTQEINYMEPTVISPQLLVYNNFKGCRPYNGSITEQHLGLKNTVFAVQQVSSDGGVLSALTVDELSDLPVVAFPGESINYFECIFDLDLGGEANNPLRDAAEGHAVSSLR